MAKIDSKLTAIRRKAAADDVEVEHLLQFAVMGDVAAVPILRELQLKHHWSNSLGSGRDHVVPLGRWVEVICTYLEGGCDALVTYAKGNNAESLHFAVSVMEEVKSGQCVLALAELTEFLVAKLPKRRGDAVKLAAAINLTQSFKNAPKALPRTVDYLRKFLHEMLRFDLEEADRSTIVCALRGVGNEDSIRLIEELPALTGPWSGLEISACQAIRKRLRNQ